MPAKNQKKITIEFDGKSKLLIEKENGKLFELASNESFYCYPNEKIKYKNNSKVKKTVILGNKSFRVLKNLTSKSIFEMAINSIEMGNEVPVELVGSGVCSVEITHNSNPNYGTKVIENSGTIICDSGDNSLTIHNIQGTTSVRFLKGYPSTFIFGLSQNPFILNIN